MKRYVAVFSDGVEIEFGAQPADVADLEHCNGSFFAIGGVVLQTICLRYIKPVEDAAA